MIKHILNIADGVITFVKRIDSEIKKYRRRRRKARIRGAFRRMDDDELLNIVHEIAQEQKRRHDES